MKAQRVVMTSFVSFLAFSVVLVSLSALGQIPLP